MDTSTSLILAFFIAMVTVPSISGDVALHFNIEEEQAIATTTIVNLKNEAAIANKFSDEQLRQVSFDFLDTAQMKKIRKYFRLETWTGILSFAEEMDRDSGDICRQLAVCDITVDIGINPTEHHGFEIVHVEITLNDANDNAPSFPIDRITESIPESTSPGLLFPIVAATDPDSPKYGIMEYRLSAPDKFRLDQQVNSDGTVDLNLMLTSLLDREREESYRMTLVAVDGGVPEKTGSIIIELHINDENDNNPVFDQAVYVKSIEENRPLSRPIVTVHASDADSGENGLLTYSFSKKSQSMYGSLFTIGAQSGEIRLKQALDYETHKSISLTVSATDQGAGSQPAYATVEITVIDRNDHAPSIIFETRSDNSDIVTITEHIDIDSFVVHASIRDPDADSAGLVDCELDDEDHFHLFKAWEKEYTIKTASDIDREVSPKYDLVLTCQDHGEPSKTTSVTIQVLVEDINDHAPTFSQSEYKVTMPEENRPHASVVQVVARDDDSGNNGRIVYMLDEDAGDDFNINPSTGLITSMITLDHEVVTFRQFHVIAMDQGEDPKHATALVSINITDIDDERPKFQQQTYIFSVPEQVPRSTEVGRVRAIDTDSPPFDKFTYYLDGAESDLKLFSIDPTTGVIFTERELDREMWDRYNLIAVAQSDSSANQQDQAEVTISITDKNDNTPFISFPKDGNETVYLHSTVPKGHIVAKVEAKDPDFGENAELTYMISEGAEHEEFVIRSRTGEILVNKDLSDYDEARFRLVLMVQDGGHPKKISVSTLIIVVTKSNVSYESSLTDNSGDNITTSPSHIPIIIGVVAGCILISIILIVAIVMMRRKQRKRPAKTSTLHYWTENGLTDKSKDMEATSGPQTTSTAISMSELSLNIKNDILKQPQLQLGKDDADSGCADVSHTESQGSSEDNEGSLQKHGSGSSTGSYGRHAPRRMDSFSNWLHQESYHLGQKGNVYRVSEQNRVSGSPAGGMSTNKKTVRFSEPQTEGCVNPDYPDDPILPPPPPEFTHAQPQPTGYYGNHSGYYDLSNGQVHYDQGPDGAPVHYDGVCYDNDGSIVIVPEKSAFSTFQSNDGSLV